MNVLTVSVENYPRLEIAQPSSVPDHSVRIHLKWKGDVVLPAPGITQEVGHVYVWVSETGDK